VKICILDSAVGKTFALVLGNGFHIDAAAVLVEEHFAVCESKQCPVTSLSNIYAGNKLTAALADQDVAGTHGLSAKLLTPRRCALLSRPLRELPCPFLCAMIDSSLLIYALISLIWTTVCS